MTKEEMMKDLLFELMGNQDFDVYLEYANQKEAIQRKEKIITELLNLLKKIQ